MSLGIAEPPPAASPAAAGPAGARFEGKVGALYMLALLAATEPRGLPGAVARAVRFQQSAAGRPLDDVTVDALNADGSEAFLDLQAKRTIDFTRSDTNFADVVRRLWATAQKPRFAMHRYEMAVTVARSSTRIERDCQQVLQWARELPDAETFAAQIGRAGFASNGMREFVETFRHHLAAANAPSDDVTVWRLLRRFLILPFDFEAPGSNYDHRAREQARLTLAPEDAGRAADLWSVLSDEALACDVAGGAVDRPALVQKLTQTYGFRLCIPISGRFMRASRKRRKTRWPIFGAASVARACRGPNWSTAPRRRSNNRASFTSPAHRASANPTYSRRWPGGSARKAR